MNDVAEGKRRVSCLGQATLPSTPAQLWPYRITLKNLLKHESTFAPSPPPFLAAGIQSSSASGHGGSIELSLLVRGGLLAWAELDYGRQEELWVGGAKEGTVEEKGKDTQDPLPPTHTHTVYRHRWPLSCLLFPPVRQCDLDQSQHYTFYNLTEHKIFQKATKAMTAFIQFLNRACNEHLGYFYVASKMKSQQALEPQARGAWEEEKSSQFSVTSCAFLELSSSELRRWH